MASSDPQDPVVSYWLMPIQQLEELARVARKVLGDRRGKRRPPSRVQEELVRRAAGRGSPDL